MASWAHHDSYIRLDSTNGTVTCNHYAFASAVGTPCGTLIHIHIHVYLDVVVASEPEADTDESRARHEFGARAHAAVSHSPVAVHDSGVHARVGADAVQDVGQARIVL